MTASSAPSPSLRHGTRRSVVLMGSGWGRHGDVLGLLSAAGLLVRDETSPADVVVLACEERDCANDVRRASERQPGAHVVVVVDPGGQRSVVRRALNAGAAGLVWANELEVALAPTVEAVCAGQLAVPLVRRDELGHIALTTREKQILGLVVMGLSNREIADKLYLAESTVKSHLSSAFSKLGVRSRNEATALILDPTSGMGPGILGIPSERLGPEGW